MGLSDVQIKVNITGKLIRQVHQRLRPIGAGHGVMVEPVADRTLGARIRVTLMVAPPPLSIDAV